MDAQFRAFLLHNAPELEHYFLRKGINDMHHVNALNDQIRAVVCIECALILELVRV